jgi:hypothetical protein
MLSVLLPSRHRPKEFEESVRSLVPVERIMVWLDDDDRSYDDYIDVFNRLPINMGMSIYRKPRVGYLKFHEMINFLASESTTPWLMTWNDDAQMPKCWYRKFYEFQKQFDPLTDPVVINIWNQDGPEANLFPIYSHKYYEILGHVSLNPACDDWTWKVAREAGISHNLRGIKPTHRKYFGDPATWIKDDVYEEIEAARAATKGHWHIYGRSTIGKMSADAIKIKNYLKERV